MMHARRLDFPATRRNREPLFEVLSRWLPASGLVLEVAAGSGQHGAAFAPRLPHHRWQPTDLDPAHLASIDAWREAVGTQNLLPALALDATADDWPVAAADAVMCANMIHIAPWAACEGLLRGSARVLPEGGVLVLYGPFHRGGQPTSESNAAFDADLRARDARWGVRDLDVVAAEAARHGLVQTDLQAMPANNLCVRFEKGPSVA